MVDATSRDSLNKSGAVVPAEAGTSQPSPVMPSAAEASLGGRSLVQSIPRGIGRNPHALAQISRGAGVHVIMGSGHYVAAVHPEGMDERTEDDLAREIIVDIVEGVEDSGIKAGMIGEIGCTWPLAPNERKSLSAAALAQQETGAAISIHPGRNPDAPLEILEILANSGADLSRVIMGHLDRTVFDFDALLSLAASGCYPRMGPFRQRGVVLPPRPSSICPATLRGWVS